MLVWIGYFFTPSFTLKPMVGGLVLGAGEWVWISPSEEHSSAISKERDS